MAGEKFRLAAKIDFPHIPFRENGVAEVMAGRINFYFLPLAAAASALTSGKLTMLANARARTRAYHSRQNASDVRLAR
jgi:tripartite-type tricarboxylate transporter receptor subunit TctC